MRSTPGRFATLPMCLLCGLLLGLPLLAGCHGGSHDDGPKPGEMRTTTGEPVPPEAMNAPREKVPPMSAFAKGGKFKGQ